MIYSKFIVFIEYLFKDPFWVCHIFTVKSIPTETTSGCDGIDGFPNKCLWLGQLLVLQAVEAVSGDAFVWMHFMHIIHISWI